MSSKKGMVYVFTGKGKGKTSAALGVAVRASLRGMKVGWVSWFKEERWQMSEMKLKEKLGGIEMFFMGEGFYNLPTDHASEKEHRQAAEMALKKAESLMKRVEVLILDEVNIAVEEGLIKVEEVLELIDKRGKTHVVLTGRGMDKKIKEKADLVTEMKKVKHPFDKGVKAVKGLDY